MFLIYKLKIILKAFFFKHFEIVMLKISPCLLPI